MFRNRNNIRRLAQVSKMCTRSDCMLSVMSCTLLGSSFHIFILYNDEQYDNGSKNICLKQPENNNGNNFHTHIKSQLLGRVNSCLCP